MPMCWLWFDHIPPELDLTPDQKRSVRARAMLHRKREPKYRGAHMTYLLHFAPIFIPTFIIYWLWLRDVIQSRAWTGLSPFITGGVCWLMVYLAIAWALHRSRTPFIRHAIRDIGYEICEDCGYWLRGLGHEVKHCPECGAYRPPMTKEPPL